MTGCASWWDIWRGAHFVVSATFYVQNILKKVGHSKLNLPGVQGPYCVNGFRKGLTEVISYNENHVLSLEQYISHLRNSFAPSASAVI